MESNRSNIFVKVITFLFGKPKIEISPYFGKMVDAGDYYECLKAFKHCSKVLDIGLAKTEEKFLKDQIDFYNWIEDNYDELIIKMAIPLENSIQELIPDFKIYSFKEEFIIDYLYIPKCDRLEYEWKISFYANNDLQHGCLIELIGEEVINISIE